MASDDNIHHKGKVVEVHGDRFKVALFDNEGLTEYIVMATIAGKIRKNRIRIVLGDQVKVAVSPYDSTKGIIKYRYDN